MLNDKSSFPIFNFIKFLRFHYAVVVFCLFSIVNVVYQTVVYIFLLKTLILPLIFVKNIDITHELIIIVLSLSIKIVFFFIYKFATAQTMQFLILFLKLAIETKR